MVETMCCEVYLIWQKKIIKNRDKSKITKHLIFFFFFLSKGNNFQYFTNSLNSKLISALDSSDQAVFNFDKHNNFNLRMRNSKFQ